MKFLIVVLILGIICRISLLNNQIGLENRIEFTTKQSSFIQIEEKLYLQKYSFEDNIDVNPLVYLIFATVNSKSKILFIACDVFICILLFLIATKAMIKDKQTMKDYKEMVNEFNKNERTRVPSISISPKELKEFEPDAKDMESITMDTNNHISFETGPLSDEYRPLTIASVYFLNPISIATCAACSLNLIFYIPLLLMVYFAYLELLHPSTLLLASVVALDIKFVGLFVPMVLIFQMKKNKFIRSLAFGLYSTFYLIYFLSNNDKELMKRLYLESKLPDLTPNVGMFWYFYTQMFTQFQEYFLFVLNSIPYIMILPICLQFHQYNLKYEALHVIIILLLLFNAYVELSNYLISCCLILMFPLYLNHMRYLMLMVVILLVTLLVQPIMTYLWIEIGSGNANFLYFQTLAFNVACFYLFLEWFSCIVKVHRLKARILAQKKK